MTPTEQRTHVALLALAEHVTVALKAASKPISVDRRVVLPLLDAHRTLTELGYIEIDWSNPNA